MRLWGHTHSAALVAALAVSQMGAKSADPFAVAAHLAVRDFVDADPLQDPTDILELLSVDPLSRAIKAEGRALELRPANKQKPVETQIEGVSPIVSKRVLSALAILDTEAPKATVRKPTNFHQLLRSMRSQRPQIRRKSEPSPLVEASIKQAARHTGVSEAYLMRAASRESSFDPNARARTSSATGLYQFLNDTWLLTFKKHGRKYGMSPLAEQIIVGTDGKAYVSNATARYQILGLRRDPVLAAYLGAEFTRDNQTYLRAKLGRHPTDGETYMAHFLGSEGAVRMIQASQRTPYRSAPSLFPKAATANRTIFYDRNGRGRSVSEVAYLLRHKGSQG